jgi:sporulation protein YlmC with PRC-barrel domain
LAVAKQSKDKGLTKDKLIGMKVVDSKGYVAGTIKDLSFTVGKVGVSLSIEDQKGEVKEVSWEDVQAAGDFVLLKPIAEATSSAPSGQQPTAAICPTCGGPLTYIQQYQRWYCYKDKKYV